MVSPTQNSTPTVEPTCSADVLSAIVADGAAKAAQLSIWAKVTPTSVYAWLRGSTPVSADTLRRIFRYLPTDWLIKSARWMTWNRLHLSPAQPFSVGQLDANGDGRLTLHDVEARLRNIDRLQLDGVDVMNEHGVSLERQRTGAVDAIDQIELEIILARATINHEHLKLN